LHGLLLLQLRRDAPRSLAERNFFHAAATTLAGMLEREKSLAALREAEARALRSQRLEAVGQLAGGIAHDFNNLLTAVLGNADLLDSQLPGLDEVASIRRAGESASRLTAQLLAFTRRQVLQPERIDVGTAVAETTQMLARILPESISLDIVAEPGELFTMADAGQLQQVLVNLIVNARDAMLGGGRLGVRAERETIERPSGAAVGETQVAPGEYVRITVSDDGVGIEEGSLERVFEPFYTTKVRSEGTGLGLSVVYGIVEQHGGFLEVESEVGHGTEFRVYLVADRAGAPTVPAAPPAPAGAGRASRAGHVLVVEDERAVRDVAAQLLGSFGYTVTTACDGPEALALFENPEFHVDAVLLDVVMPELSGIETYERLRRLRAGQPVVFMTGHDPTAGLKDLIGEDAVALLHKPFTRAQLGDSMRELLGDGASAE
jgi:signal transduction histidine kinase/CheY-like chemotaxis protein